MKNRKFAIGIIVVVIGVLWYLGTQKKSDTGEPSSKEYGNVQTFDSDKTVEGDYVIKSDEKIILKNGAQLTVGGNFALQGALECENGPIKLIVKGKMLIDSIIRCNRADDISDAGIGVALVAQDGALITEKAVIISNGHIQVVDSSEKLATTKESLDKLYDEAGKNSGEGLRVGPLTNDGKVSLNNLQIFSRNIRLNTKKILPNFNIFSAYSASAQEIAQDIWGNVVANAVKIGGTWVVGKGEAPPSDIAIPTPPKNVNKIILNFNFRKNAKVILSDIKITGPDGRNGKDGEISCDSKGANGEDAFRFLVVASNLTINNFDLNLGSGGAGGNAETAENCEHGKAKGGDGGRAGNFKMIATENFNIEGLFNIYPGRGGAGGRAIAHGKLGKDGCAGENGGKAASNGGAGGGNNKKLEAARAVNGISNVVVHDVIGGAGGDAESYGGAGGGGTGCKCNGGLGGGATAIGGRGGDAGSSNGSSTGGNGGNAKSEPGMGGQGGSCDATGPGGNGGKGGDASTTFGKGGVGTSGDGVQGKDDPKTGGNGGNGGDGCGPGSGGKGGKGNPAGKDGAPGKNLCIPPKTDTSTSVTAPTTNEAPKEETTQPEENISITPQSLSFVHNIGTTECPTPIGSVQIAKTGAGGSNKWKITSSLPAWLQAQTSGSIPGSTSFNFTCQLNEYVTQSLSASVTFELLDTSGKSTGEKESVSVKGQINAR